MTRLWGKALRAFIAVSLVACLVPSMAFASTSSDSSDRGSPAEGLVSIVKVVQWFPDYEASFDFASYGARVSEDEAEDVIREQMIARVEGIKVAVEADDVDSPSKLVQNLMEDVLEETDDPCAGDYLRFHIQSWSSSVAHYKGGTTYWIELSVDYNSTAAQERQVNAKVDQLISDLGFSSKSDYEKIKAIHDWICLNVVYDNEHGSDSTYRTKYSAYGALCDGTAVCQGYATLFYRLCREAGLSARVIPGIGSTSSGAVSHAWNIVELNGAYYDVDPTWDAKLSSGDYADDSYFLKCEADFAGHNRSESHMTEGFSEEYPMATSSYVKSTRSISNAKAKLSYATCVYSGSAKRPAVTVKDGSRTLIKGVDYTAAYSNNVNVGTAKVTLTGIGDYKGSLTLTYVIKPKATSLSSLTARNNGFTAKWSKVASQCTGYQIRYSTKSNMSGAASKTITSFSTTSRAISGLKDSATYYVQIRTYKTVGGIKYYSAWSAAKKIRTK